MSAEQLAVKRFEMTSLFFEKHSETFTELDAPTWLTSEKTVRGSTADGRWFWKDHVLTLRVNEQIQTDFRVIRRVA